MRSRCYNCSYHVLYDYILESTIVLYLRVHSCLQLKVHAGIVSQLSTFFCPLRMSCYKFLEIYT